MRGARLDARVVARAIARPMSPAGISIASRTWLEFEFVGLGASQYGDRNTKHEHDRYDATYKLPTRLLQHRDSHTIENTKVRCTIA